MDAFLKDGHPTLGSVPGPLVLAGHDGTIWAAGGGRGESSVLRFGAEGWRAWPIDAHGVRAVLPLDDRTAVVAGEHGFLAVIDTAIVDSAADDEDDEGVVEIKTRQGGCLFGLTPIGDLIWVTGEKGFVATLDPRTRELRAQPRFDRKRVVRAVAAPGGEPVFVVGRQILRRLPDGTEEMVFSGHAPLTDLAYSSDGGFAVAGDAGQLYLAAPGGTPEPCDGVPALDMECLSYDPRRDRFVVAGEDGYVGALGRDGALRPLPAAEPPYRLTSILPWGDGHLYAGWVEQGPPYRFRGALYFDGEHAPDRVYEAPRQDFGPPRTRTVGRSGRPSLAVDAFQLISFDEAQRRMPEVEWPDEDMYSFEEIRFYDGDVHVADTGALFDDHRDDYGVAIRGDLIVDGTLDAVAGGDAYGSILAVQGDVWAHAALFRYGINAAISGALEVATVVLCDHGDDGGLLTAEVIRAQVLHYSLYFAKPEAKIDAFCVGNVYGDLSFPPGRAKEVFVAGVLEDGYLEEDTAANWLREGRSILREAN
ncbi:hypothetical protein [Actinomadura litoris]|uniref:Uncharacterized protein n=1 Tax=Actinomadura litoris TaxID=2678616 RepID=A0A7K1LDJ8_9ACTN|nr:hypothetical protein [Actinomadura litoris]MUN42511.1 hypothetical protein [Actinomadura litoris]